ncbi:MAG: hypothetical protein ABI039_05220, partial [Vicinamibacterales bacterium]
EAPLNAVTSADPAKWLARYDGKTFAGVAIEAVDFQKLRIGLSQVGEEAGADELSYTNAPSDIGDDLGRMLAALSGFPI